LSCLDNIISDCDPNKIICGTVGPPLSDHLGLWAIYAASVTPNFPIDVRNRKVMKRFRSVQMQNIMHLRAYIQNNIHLLLINPTIDVDLAWEKFVQCIHQGIQETCPLKQKKSNSKRVNFAWYTRYLQSLKSELSYWYGQIRKGNIEATTNYKKLRQKYRKQILQAKIDYNDVIMRKSSNKNSAAWSIIKKNSNIGSDKTYPEASLNDINKYFVNNIPNCNTDILSNWSVKSDICDNLNRNICSVFRIKTISYANVILAVKKLKNGLSEDVFGLSSYMLKHIIDLIYVPLCDLMNYSIIQGKFPTILKNSIVIPVYKNGDKRKIGNYRPIALVPIFSKVFEFLILEQLQVYFKSNNFLSDNQFGFQPGKSTIEAIDKVVNNIYSNYEHRKHTLATLVDLTKAFDTISHSVLLNKLQFYGIELKELNLIATYLIDRKQVVRVNGEISDELIVKRGVPQGSILGPFLFLIYMNDFPTMSHTIPILYADDTTLLTSSKDMECLKADMKKGLDIANDWFTTNGLMPNPKKTETILFSLTNNNIHEFHTKHVKLLGLILDCDLSWNEHVDSIVKKLAKHVYILRKLKCNVSLNCLVMAFHALIQSHINYGILFWGASVKIRDVFVWQKKAIRTMIGISNNKSCRGHFKSLGILTVPCCYIFHVIIYTKKHLDNYETGAIRHGYHTRNKNLLIKPNTRLQKIYRSHLVQGVKFYNILPVNVKKLQTKNFKFALKKLLLQCEGYTYDEIYEYFKKLNNGQT
jgi:hypothetical protein